MVSRRRVALVAVALGVASAACAEEAVFVAGARILTAAGEPISTGGIVVRDGTIAEVAAGLKRPAFSRLLDAEGLTVTPGFVVPVTRLGTPPPPPPPPGEGLRVEVKPDVKAADDALLHGEALRGLLRHGVTTAGLLPVSREPGIPGFASAVATGCAGASGAVLAEDAALVVLAITPRPWRRAVGEAFERADAARHERELSVARGKSEGDPAPLEKVLQRKKPVVIFAGSPALLVAACDSMPCERLDASVVDGTDLWWEARRVKELGLRVLTPPNLVRQRGTRFPINRAAEWAKAGVKVAFVLPDDSLAGASRLRDAAAELVRSGLSPDKALAALTSEPAAALGMGSSVGSIQAGRRADLLFWSGDPFDPSSRLVRVMAGGELLEGSPRAELDR